LKLFCREISRGAIISGAISPGYSLAVKNKFSSPPTKPFGGDRHLSEWKRWWRNRRRVGDSPIVVVRPQPTSKRAQIEPPRLSPPPPVAPRPNSPARGR